MKPPTFPAFSKTILVCLAFCSFVFGGQERPRQIEEKEADPQGRAALSVKVDQVRVDVTVHNKDGNLITGLEREHFTIFEDKVAQEITYFEPIDAPITAVLITEFSRAMFGEWLWEAIQASHTFVDQMRPGDWVAAIAYDIKPEILVDFTQDKSQVFDALRRLNNPAFRESNLYDTIVDTLDRIEEVDGKVAIVLLSTGQDTFSKINLDNVLDRVRQTNAVIYAVSLGGHLRAKYEDRFSSTYRMDLYQADAVLKSFAKFTGGEAFFPRFTAQYPSIFRSISALLRNQYALGYVSTNSKKKDEVRKIKVEASADVDGDGKADKLKVQHRSEYMVRQDRP